MGQQDTRVPAETPGLRYQAVREFPNGARVVVAAFETEIDAELYAETRLQLNGHDITVQLDPVWAQRDEEVRTLIRNLRTTHPADEALEPLGTEIPAKPCGFCEAVPGDNDHCAWDGTPHYWHRCNGIVAPDSNCPAVTS